MTLFALGFRSQENTIAFDRNAVIRLIRLMRASFLQIRIRKANPLSGEGVLVTNHVHLINVEWEFLARDITVTKRC